jgi:bifunctional UDP-N-acetylglucosamine pyrophosphorylase/glucosamine-1-phosphate N-acetyltransferase
MGVNNRLQLEELERLYQQRIAEQLLLEGVAIFDRNRLDVRGTLTCGDGVVIDVNAVFEGDVVLEDNVRIGPNCVIRNAHIQANTTIHAFTHVEDTNIGANCSVGPYARLRPGTKLADGVKIGNFVETKNTSFAHGSKANHLAYVGDAQVGADSNLGAGTITCNYDGAHKHPTVIGEHVFVGSNSTLVAPVVIADRGFVAAGSVVTNDVDTAQLAVGRARQRNIDGWSAPSKSDSPTNKPQLEP